VEAAPSLQNGVHLLPFYAHYDQRTPEADKYLMLTTSFLNNHCLSKNIQTGVWSLANAITDIEVTEPPDSSYYTHSSGEY